MIHLKEKAIVITLPAEEPAQKLVELQDGLIYVLKDFFGHLGNEVDIEGGAAYNDLLSLLRATMQASQGASSRKRNRNRRKAKAGKKAIVLADQP